MPDDTAYPAMSRTAARILADRLEQTGLASIRAEKEFKLIVAALRYYGAPPTVNSQP